MYREVELCSTKKPSPTSRLEVGLVKKRDFDYIRDSPERDPFQFDFHEKKLFDFEIFCSSNRFVQPLRVRR